MIIFADVLSGVQKMKYTGCQQEYMSTDLGVLKEAQKRPVEETRELADLLLEDPCFS